MEDEELLEMVNAPRLEKHSIFKTRSDEGYFKILISNHFQGDNIKFSQFFRLSKFQFEFVSSLIKEDLKKSSINIIPYPLTAEEKLRLTDGESQDKENPEIIDLRDELPEVKVEILQEESTEVDPLSEDPLRISKESEESTSKSYKINSENREEMIVPEIVDDSSIGCSENIQSSFIRLIHPDQLIELTPFSKETIQMSEGCTQTDTSFVLNKGSTPQSTNVSGNLFSRPKSAEKPGSFKVIEMNTTSENSQSISQMKLCNSRSISAPVKLAPSDSVNAVNSMLKDSCMFIRKLMLKVKQTQNADANVQNNENKVTVSNQPDSSTTNVQSITTTANTPNISAGQFLPFATTTVSASSQQISHNLGLPVQISTSAVTHSVSGVLQPQWIVRPLIPSQPQPTFVLNKPSPSLAIPQPVLVSRTNIPNSDTTEHKNMCYIKTPQGYVKKIETPPMKPAVSEPSEKLNKVPIPRYYVSRFPVPTQTLGTRGGSRGGRFRAGRPRGGRGRHPPVWQNKFHAQHTTCPPPLALITPVRGPATGQAVQRTPLSQENAE